MPRDSRLSLDDILEASEKIRRYTANCSREDFRLDSKTIDAVVRNLEIVGEAVKHVPEPIRSRYPAVEWRRIAGLRDILFHQYFGVNIDIIRDVIHNKLPLLEEQVREILSNHFG